MSSCPIFCSRLYGCVLLVLSSVLLFTLGSDVQESMRMHNVTMGVAYFIKVVLFLDFGNGIVIWWYIGIWF